MKRYYSILISVLFFFAIQIQSLTSYAHLFCDHLQTQESEHHEDTDHDHETQEQSNEACNHQHHCCGASTSAYQAPKLQSQIFNVDSITSNFPSLSLLAIEDPILEGPFQPPRV
jgi:hypothetical protein